MMPAMALWTLLWACETPTEADSLVTWAGWVYAGPETVETARLGAGSVTFWPAPFAESEQIAAAQPYEDYVGYWSVDVPPDQPVLVRVVADELHPTVWAGDTPSADGNWFAGALFAVEDGWLEDVFDALGADGDAWVEVLTERAIVLGYPASDAIVCEDLTVESDAGVVAPSCWSVGEEGDVAEVRTGPIDWFAAQVSAGEVRVGIGGASELYVAAPGDVVMAWYLTGVDP